RRNTRSKRDWSSDVCSSDLDFLLANQNNYKKAKDQKITAADLNRNDVVGEVLRDYQSYVDLLNNSNMQAYRRNRLKGEVQRDMRSEERRVGKESREMRRKVR